MAAFRLDDASLEEPTLVGVGPDRDAVLSRTTATSTSRWHRSGPPGRRPGREPLGGHQGVRRHGEAYLDCGGFGVFLLGHCHPTVVRPCATNWRPHPLATRLFLNPQQAAAAEVLAGVAPAGLDYVFLTNSGAEAVELGLEAGPPGRQDPRSSPCRVASTARPWVPSR